MTLKTPQQTTRKTLNDIDKTPSPQELYEQVMQGKGWPYKTNMEFYLKRDRAFVSLLYLCACRISEAMQLKVSQFKPEKNRIVIESMLLAKRKPGKVKYREAWLPLNGERAPFTQLIFDYLEALKIENPNAQRLFPWSLKRVEYQIFYKSKLLRSVRFSGTNRAWNVVKALLPEATAHWLRQYGDDYLYDQWDHDIMAVSDYTKQDARTLQLYLRKRYQKYKSV
jgi:integrase